MTPHQIVSRIHPFLHLSDYICFTVMHGMKTAPRDQPKPTLSVPEPVTSSEEIYKNSFPLPDTPLSTREPMGRGRTVTKTPRKEDNRSGPASGRRAVHWGVCPTGRAFPHQGSRAIPGASALPCSLRQLRACPEPRAPGCQGLLGLDRNLRPRVPSPAPRPRPRQPPRRDAPGKALPTSRPPGPRRTQPRELLSPDSAAGPSRDLRRCLHPQPAQLQLRRRQPRTPMGQRSRAGAAAEASGTAATSTGGVSRQGVGASGHATLAPPKNRVGPTPRWPGAEPRKTWPGVRAGPGRRGGARSGAGSRLLGKAWTEGRGLRCET